MRSTSWSKRSTCSDDSLNGRMTTTLGGPLGFGPIQLLYTGDENTTQLSFLGFLIEIHHFLDWFRWWFFIYGFETTGFMNMFHHHLVGICFVMFVQAPKSRKSKQPIFQLGPLPHQSGNPWYPPDTPTIFAYQSWVVWSGEIHQTKKPKLLAEWGGLDRFA